MGTLSISYSAVNSVYPLLSSKKFTERNTCIYVYLFMTYEFCIVMMKLSSYPPLNRKIYILPDTLYISFNMCLCVVLFVSLP